ncbi:MAG: phosphoribosyltransferase [Gemmatimonadetes bacterium]|nr:phosphoribosyltransferase [Gemmatimonadota bacterium]
MPTAFSRPRTLAISAAQGTFELSWELFGEMCRALAVRVARDFRPDLVIGIATAGVMPAATVAAMLDAEFESMKISRREGSIVSSEPRILSATPVRCRGKRVLIVDEITGSGDTMRLALAAVREVGPADVRTAATFVRPGGWRPDYFGMETGQLIVYPWDRQVITDGELVAAPIYEAAAM